MRAGSIVVEPPGVDDVSGLGQTDEPVLVQTLIPEPPVEAFDETVLDGFPRIDESQLHSVLVRPLVEDPAGELRTVVHENGLGKAALAGCNQPQMS